MKNERKQFKISGLMALILFGVFSVCILLLLLTGADVYKSLTTRDNDVYSYRTASQYISTKVRQNDIRGMISVEDFGGEDALVLCEDIEGYIYETKLYCYDGYLMELFCEEGSELNPEDGEKILEVTSAQFSMEGSMVIADITMPDGTEENIKLYIRSEKGGLQ